MQLQITEDDLISNIQSGFHRRYPWLKLAFYKNPHIVGQASPIKEILDPALPIEDIRMFHTGGTIDIGPERTVAAVEHDFLEKFGLCVQVLRRSGSLWLETSVSDHLNLRQQNEKGWLSCSNTKEGLPDDYRLQDID